MSASIAIIHAVRAAVSPIEKTFERLWPDADLVNVLDETLSRDMAKAGELTPELMARIDRLGKFGRDGGADAILYSCSAFGEAIEATREGIDLPVLKPNEAMLEEALNIGKRILLAATFKPSIAPVLNELKEMAEKMGKKVDARSCFASGAFDALNQGNLDRHDTLIAEAVEDSEPCDVVLLAQFSMARALPAVSKVVSCKVLSSPDSAVAQLKQRLNR
ncbi:MAG: arylsulfatase [Rhodospirillales bacterium]|jgi:Asp/Glu/hydantoin racemase|nr:arylsulfatase [Rhodospirillales bacterium]MBT3906113.1 arylsulfatase [Rhodospirillaceae bacterium]MBT5033597.1 arylsulfatase [Rhodospirillaceae bacterium]MBT6220079.1 arylsulfatase [Rhodospirillaceae bacterium]MBT6362020.1 arylsulfatase [Rhodospirillaceae bacterium]